ncbi:MAG: phage tail tube protein [Candidatus Bipolaricaulota bacterium]|nr:phage tail tube protein [Candidatus Bipolaricaulota bacterium]
MAKLETTYGQDAQPTPSANFIPVFDVAVAPDTNYLDPSAQDGSLSPRSGRIGMRSVEVTFSHHLLVKPAEGGSGPTLVADPLLRACGLVPVQGVYKPISTGFPSVTLYVYFDGLLWKVVGCRGNVSLNFSAGEFATLEFTFRGRYLPPVDQAFPSSWVDVDVAPIVCVGGSVTWNNQPLHVEAITLDLGNDLQLYPSVSADHGVYEAAIVNRDPSGTLNPEMTLVATKDWHTLMLTPTLQELKVVLTDGQSDVTLTVPRAQITEIGHGDRNGIRTWDITFKPIRVAGDDEVQLAVTDRS